MRIVKSHEINTIKPKFGHLMTKICPIANILCLGYFENVHHLQVYSNMELVLDSMLLR